MKSGARKLSLKNAGFFLSVLLFAGCSILPHPVTLTKYQPTNIYQKAAILPADVRRLAVLPLNISDTTALLQAGAETLQPTFYTELEKTKKFEVIVVSPEQLRQWTGRSFWKSAEQLPLDFFLRLRDKIGNDAVLFGELTSYQPYPPITVGWKLTLVTADTTQNLTTHIQKPEILWSANEVFNAGNPEVANAAEAFSSWNHRNEAPLADSSSIFTSPVRFGQYSLSALFNTLPTR